MSAVSILHALLVADSNLVAVVPVVQIISGIIPQGTPLPCVAVTEVVTTEVPHIDANSPDCLVDGRVQATIMASNYVQKKQVMTLVRKACNYKRGYLAGFQVTSVRRIMNGPDFSDNQIGLHLQSIDFNVSYYEPS